MSIVILGFFHSGKDKPTILHEIDLTIRNSTFCQDRIYKWAVSEEENGTFFSNGIFCAGGEKGKDACKGDSGSAIFTKQEKKVVQIGLVSGGFGDECGTEGYPTFYTRVQYYLKWILDNIEE